MLQQYHGIVPLICQFMVIICDYMVILAVYNIDYITSLFYQQMFTMAEM